MSRRLWATHGASDRLVFTDSLGRQLTDHWLRHNVLDKAASSAGVPWVGFHTFRHTCASLLFAGGKNIKQVEE
jgi:integrase